MPSIVSPDVDAFSTPPTSPTPDELPPSFSRRNSGRPSNLQLEIDPLQSDVVLEEQSPDSARAKLLRKNGHMNNGPQVPPNTAIRMHPSKTLPSPMQPMQSPCFVHSNLDKGVSLADWLRTKQSQSIGDDDVGISMSRQREDGRYQPIANAKSHVFGVHYPDRTSSEDSEFTPVDYEGDYGDSLTRQLAETAVGVREMSKQLGE